MFDLVAHIAHQMAWSCKTFGPGIRTEGVTDHIGKELNEIRADPTDLKEWVDVIILGFDGAWRCIAQDEPVDEMAAQIIAEMIVRAIVTKQTKNEGRKWPDWRTADPKKAIEHDRSDDHPPRAVAAISEGADPSRR